MSGAHPFALAVLIATHNRRETLVRCLGALEQQSADPGSFEVIVADDGSSDGTHEMLTGISTGFRLRSLRLEKAGKPAALNAALAAVESEACLFIDDDVIASPHLVREHIAAHQANPDALALGRLVQRPPSARDPYAEAAAVRWNRRYEELGSRAPEWTDCYGANFSAPSRALTEIGGFAADLAAIEDLEIGFRLCRAGCVPIYLPHAEAVHDDEKPGARVLADEQRFGAWCAEFVAKNPEARSKLLGWFAEAAPREAGLRHLLLKLRVTPTALARAGRGMPAGSARQLWFDFVSRYTFWYGVRTASDRESWRQAIGGVPVLMYHAFTDGTSASRFVLPRRAFARQMRMLALLRYRVIGFEEVAEVLREGRPLPRRAVVVTIDDGYADNFEIAYPILRRHGFSATLFLISRRLGAKADWSGDPGPTDGRPLLDLEEVRQMRSGGIAVGAHTRTHPSLTGLPPERAEEEIAGSRADLEAAIGGPVPTFAYPYGELDAQAADAVRRASFRGACTTDPRHARFGDDPLRVPRIEVRGTDTMLRFLRKVWLGGQ